MHAILRHPRTIALALSMALSLSERTVFADVYFEITPAGRAPDGLVDFQTDDAPTAFNIYVWGSGLDVILRTAEFNIAAPPASWTMLSLGTVDPNHRFPGPNAPGTLQPDYVSGVRVNSLPGLLLPQSPADALLIYADFHASAIAGNALLGVVATSIATNAGATSVCHSIGVEEIPEPATVTLLLLGFATRRRRRVTEP